MYKALDSFLEIETWHTAHPLDAARFYKALDLIVREPGFNPEEMGEHISAKVQNPALDYAVRQLVTQAWAVREFLTATGKRED